LPIAETKRPVLHRLPLRYSLIRLRDARRAAAGRNLSARRGEGFEELEVEDRCAGFNSAGRKFRHGHLQAIEKYRGSAGVDGFLSEALKDLVKSRPDAIHIEVHWDFDLRIGFAVGARRRGSSAGVAITEGIAAHGGRLAAETTGHDVMAGIDHISSSR
jgi:hypothetical protein